MSIESITAGYSTELADLAAQLRAGVVQVRAEGRGIGTGIVWSTAAGADGQSEATVITNAHVVRAVRGSNVTLLHADGRELDASVLAIDPARDLAALRVRAGDLTPLEIGDSSALRIGEVVLAVGNPFGRFNSLTLGVVAARAPVDPDLALAPAETPKDEEPPVAPRDPRGRWRLPRLEVIQADIRLYPGNSGGPLTDARGRVVGVNTMVGGGLAFAIPSHTVRQFLGEVEHAIQRPYVGVQVLTVPLPDALRQRHDLAAESAALVAGVEPESPAEKAGMLVGDVILGVNDLAVPAAEFLPGALARAGAAGVDATLSLLRGGERLEITLQPALRAAA
jgi:serine protease Do